MPARRPGVACEHTHTRTAAQADLCTAHSTQAPPYRSSGAATALAAAESCAQPVPRHARDAAAAHAVALPARHAALARTFVASRVNASDTLCPCSASVSRYTMPYCAARSSPSLCDTTRSLGLHLTLLATSMMHRACRGCKPVAGSAWLDDRLPSVAALTSDRHMLAPPRARRTHVCTCLKECALVTSYTNMKPAAPAQ